MSDDDEQHVTRRELVQAEAKLELLIRTLSREIKMEVRWLILASVGLNQILANSNLSGIANAGLIGGFLVVSKVVIVFFSAR